MKNDPIVEEVRAARRKIFEACDQDLEALLDRFQMQEELDRERVVSEAATQAKRDTEGHNRVRP
jgi:hypothetical protein